MDADCHRASHGQAYPGWLLRMSQKPGVARAPGDRLAWTLLKYLSFCTVSPLLLSSLVSHPRSPHPSRFWLPASPTLPLL